MGTAWENETATRLVGGVATPSGFCMRLSLADFVNDLISEDGSWDSRQAHQRRDPCRPPKWEAWEAISDEGPGAGRLGRCGSIDGARLLVVPRARSERRRCVVESQYFIL
jgi:hypothetical protein